MKNFLKSKLLIFLLIVFNSSCTNEFDYGSIVNAVKTIDFTNVTQTTATVSGLVITDNGESLTERGICYGTVNYPTIANSKKINETAVLGDYACILDNLSPSTTYFARAYATNSYGTAYGEPITFTTLVATVPILSTTSSANLVTATTARTGGIITNSGASSVTSRGVCYSNTATIPTIANTKTLDGTGIGTFISSLTGLATNTTYYIRAYATNGSGTGYGDVKTFTTTTATIPQGITTISATSITQTSASSGGNITSDGGAAISAKGICWSNITTTPTIANSNTNNGVGITSFASSITSLAVGTTYYVRAYATNSVGTAYGNTISFTTIAATIPQGITTISPTSISQTTASSGGNITSDGGAAITAKGVCWSNTTTTPTIANNNTNNGVGSASFVSSITILAAATIYYVRAYATNSAGTAYGNTISFTTLPNLSVGQSYQGGIIAYIFTPGDNGWVSGQTHGIIATNSNQSTGSQWGCSGISIAGTTLTLSTGIANTNAIVSGCTNSTIAAAICNNLTFGGYTDWYLPSIDDLSKLYSNRTLIGGFVSTSYWSSSQASATTAYSFSFISGLASNISAKNSLMYVRAIRYF